MESVIGLVGRVFDSTTDVLSESDDGVADVNDALFVGARRGDGSGSKDE